MFGICIFLTLVINIIEARADNSNYLFTEDISWIRDEDKSELMVEQKDGIIISAKLSLGGRRATTFVTRSESDLSGPLFGSDKLVATVWMPDSLGGVLPRAVCYNSTNNKFYLFGGRRIAVIDGATNSRLKSITVDEVADVASSFGITVFPSERRRLAYNPINNKIYCATDGGNLVVIDCSTDSVIATFHVGQEMMGYFVVYNQNTNRVYYMKGGPGIIKVIDGAGDTIIGEAEIHGILNDIICNPAGNKIYVSRQVTRAVVILDASTFEIIAELPIEGCPNIIEYNPNSNKVYCATISFTGTTDTIIVIDGIGDSVITFVDVPSMPFQLLCNPTDNKIYCNGYIIDGELDTVIATYSLPGAYAIAYNSIDDYIFCGGRDTVIVIDGVSNEIIRGGKPGGFSVQFAYNIVENTICCANQVEGNAGIIDREANLIAMPYIGMDGSNGGCYNSRENKVYFKSIGFSHYNIISVIDGETNIVRSTIPIEALLLSNIGYNLLNNKLYVASEGIVKVIDGVSDTVVANIPVGRYPGSVFAHDSTNKVYCGNCGSDDISIIDGATNEVITTLGVGGAPYAFTYNTINKKVYACLIDVGSVAVIDGVTDALITKITVGSYTRSLVYNSVSNKVYSINSGTNDVTVIDGATDEVIKKINVANKPHQVVYSPINNKVYVLSFDGVVTVIDGETDEVIKQLETQANSLIYNPDNNRVYLHILLASISDHRMLMKVIDCNTDAICSIVSLEQSQPLYGWTLHFRTGEVLVYNSANNKVYCGNYGMSNVSVIQCAEAGVDEFTRPQMTKPTVEIYPNPFTRSTVISYELHAVGEVLLQVYDISGRLLKTLIHGTKGNGIHSINWTVNGIPDGIYFLRLESQGEGITKKVVVIR
ncbi:MAG: T9SS type A sorting domain-containing protein [bacterium]|nr:T9SS type A sorting domain-containing protein [bacterium]